MFFVQRHPAIEVTIVNWNEIRRNEEGSLKEG
jgi:hypothetical protein